MFIVIKNPAPRTEESIRWGDYHFGKALQRALEERGARVVQHFHGEWDKDEYGDLVLVLRGLRPYEPRSREKAALWIISHPASISRHELQKYDLIYCGSQLSADLVCTLTDKPVRLLRQCTDVSKFDCDAKLGEGGARDGVVFVANARGVRRDIARWASECVGDLKIYGGGWEYFGLQEYVVESGVNNDDLPSIYRSARVGLNDHWADMRHFGIINNRIFDYLACGLPVISDSFPELRAVFGDAVLYADSEVEFREAAAFLDRNYSRVVSNVKSFWDREKKDYSFESRAVRMLEDFELLKCGGRLPAREPQPRYSELQAMLWESISENARCQENQIRSREKLLADMRRQLHSESKRQQALIEEVGEYALTLERDLNRLKHSISWRLTVPLRWLKSVYRRIRWRSSNNRGALRKGRPSIVVEIERHRRAGRDV